VIDRRLDPARVVVVVAARDRSPAEPREIRLDPLILEPVGEVDALRPRRRSWRRLRHR
jgi:hypothetical protein